MEEIITSISNKKYNEIKFLLDNDAFRFIYSKPDETINEFIARVGLTQVETYLLLYYKRKGLRPPKNSNCPHSFVKIKEYDRSSYVGDRIVCQKCEKGISTRNPFYMYFCDKYNKGETF